ncbi:hypothetical protein AB0J52_29395, partial [Spirillospora sp. NPDC049652]
GRASGLTALAYADRLLRAGRADAVIAGAFDELTDRRLAVEAAAGRPAADAAEGCCVFLLESARSARAAGRRPLAELLAHGGGVGADVGAVARRVLRRAGTSPEAVRLAVGDLGDTPAPNARVLDARAIVGDTAGAAAAFQAAAALVTPGAGLTLLSALDPDGQVACALLRVGDGDPVPFSAAGTGIAATS